MPVQGFGKWGRYHNISKVPLSHLRFADISFWCIPLSKCDKQCHDETWKCYTWARVQKNPPVTNNKKLPLQSVTVLDVIRSFKKWRPSVSAYVLDSISHFLYLFCYPLFLFAPPVLLSSERDRDVKEEDAGRDKEAKRPQKTGLLGTRSAGKIQITVNNVFGVLVSFMRDWQGGGYLWCLSYTE